MVQDVDTQDVGQDDEEQQDRRRGILPLIILIIVILIILWLLGRFLGSSDSKVVKVVKRGTVKIAVPLVPEPDLPLSIGSDERAKQGALVPNVVGDPLASAIITLENAGYSVSVTYVNSDSVPSGLVISQYPNAGSPLRAGGTVGLVVSRGNGQVRMVTMPNIIGLTQKAAMSKVRSAGFKPYLLHGTDRRYPGKVGSQWPPAGTRLPEGSDGFVQVMIPR